LHRAGVNRCRNRRHAATCAAHGWYQGQHGSRWRRGDKQHLFSASASNATAARRELPPWRAARHCHCCCLMNKTRHFFCLFAASRSLSACRCAFCALPPSRAF